MEWILELLFWIFFDIIFRSLWSLFTWTGEVILFIVTLGRYKPRWDFYTNSEALEKTLMFFILSPLLGAAFWIVVVALAPAVIFRTW